MLSSTTAQELRDLVRSGMVAADLLAASGMPYPGMPHRVTRTSAASTPGNPDRAALKVWGAAHGVHIADRGRIAAETLRQYEEYMNGPALTVGEGEDVVPAPEESRVLVPTFQPPERASRPSARRNAASKAA